MTLPHNVERSAFHPDTYVIYDSFGHIWRAKQVKSKQWRAIPAPNNPARSLGVEKAAHSLRELAGTLAHRHEPRVVEPF